MMGGGTGCLGAYPQMKYLLPGMRPTTITAADLEPFKVHLLLSQKHSVCVRLMCIALLMPTARHITKDWRHSPFS